MSNSIAPGSSADVNVRVTALTTNPNVPAQYKTIILKKNLVNGVNTLTQEMMSAANTKYVIKYDYVLGEDITVPANCILEFDGGSINPNSNNITANLLNDYINPIWFGADPNGVNDSTVAIQTAINIASDSIRKKVFVPGGTYLISSPLLFYRYKNVDFGGVEKDTVIKASETMDCMITTGTTGVNKYISSCFHDFILEGNRDGSYVIDSSGITANAPKASKGMYFPEGFIYTYVKNVHFQNLNYGIYALKNWGVVYDSLYFRYSNIGIVTSTANGNKITNCDFSTIGEFGVVVADGHSCIIQNNIFEVIGKAAVVCAAQIQSCLIDNNYFEAASITGVNLSTYQNRYNIDDIHAAIISIGNAGSDFATLNTERYDCVRTYPNGSINVTNNSFQFNENGCIVFASSILSGSIKDNTSTVNVAVLGTILDLNSCRIQDVEISRNFYHYNTKLLEDKVKIIDKASIHSSYWGINSLTDIYSNDLEPDGIYNRNLTNVSVLTTNCTYIKELETKYRNQRVFKAVGNGNIYLNTLYLNYFVRFDYSQIGTDKAIIATYYKKETVDGNEVWNRYFANTMMQQTLVSIAVSDGDEITLPVCYVAGANLKDSEEYIPVCGNYNLKFPENVHYLPKTKLTALDNRWVDGLIIDYDNDNIDNTIKTKLISNNLLGSISELSNETRYAATVYKGLTIIRDSDFKQLIWNGTAWVDTTGTPV